MNTHRTATATAAALTAALLLGACTQSPPEPPRPAVLVNPTYPRDTFDVAHPKTTDPVTCDRYTAEEATRIVGAPAIQTDVGGGNCNYFGPYGLLVLGLYTQVDTESYNSADTGRRATVNGNSAWVEDFGVDAGCDVYVALTTDPGGYSLYLKTRDLTDRCENLLAAAEIILSRTPDDPTVEPRVIPDLDRYRTVIDPEADYYTGPYRDGPFPPDGWTITTLDDPRYLHPGDVGPAPR